MEKETTRKVRDVRTSKDAPAAPLKRLPRRGAATTKQMHDRLLRALRDRRIKRAFD